LATIGLVAVLPACGVEPPAVVQWTGGTAGGTTGGTIGSMRESSELTDRFGVHELYPSLPSGREWYLPDLPAELDAQWIPETNVTSTGPGTYHAAGQVRLNIGSPKGAAWWRNVEMTAYFYDTGKVNDSSGQLPHWELFARGERHNHNSVKGNQVNQGVPAPAGTVSWPGYPFGTGAILPACLGTAYHGNIYPDGHVLFEKEISHTAGYATNQRGVTHITGFSDPLKRWFGFKFVAYDRSQQDVHIELWLDADGDGNWVLVAQTDDAGGWKASDLKMDGCTKAPFSYQTDQILAWAAPWVTFRADAIGFDFKWLSVREIQPPE
jgi:hypothetical protein